MDKIKTVKKKKIDNPIWPIWLTVSQAAQLGGINAKTIRRAIKSKTIAYKIINSRYFIDLASLIIYLHSSIKLKNKFEQFGIEQYVEKWKN